MKHIVNLLVSGVCACVVALSCTSQSSKTVKPAAGDAGSDAGPDAASACTQDSECDDDDPCNGLEKCGKASKLCEPGKSPCTGSSDPAHCVIACINNSGQAECGKEEARDADGDGHGDSKCAVAPGDDCDDADKNVYAGAPETCDGVDSNCNGVDDVHEPGIGTSTAPTFTIKATSSDAIRPQVVWNASAKKFGVVWMDKSSGDRHVYVSTFNEAGQKDGTDLRISDLAFQAYAPSIAAVGVDFGVSYLGEFTGTHDIKFQRVTAALAKSGPEKMVAAGVVRELARPHMVASGSDYVVTYVHDVGSRSIKLVRLDAAGDLVDAPVTLGPSDGQTHAHPVLAAGPSGLAAIWGLGGTVPERAENLELALVSPALVAGNQGPVASPGAFTFATPAVVATSAGWSGAARAVGATGSLYTFEAGSTGTRTCERFDSSFGAAVDVGTAALTPVGPVVAVIDGVGVSPRIALAVLGAGCTPKEAIDVASAITHPGFEAFFGHGPGVAVSENKVAVVWDEKPGQFFQVRARIFGKNFCD